MRKIVSLSIMFTFFALLMGCGPDVEVKYYSKKKDTKMSEYTMAENAKGQSLRNGPFSEFYRNGKVSVQGMYAMGKKDGTIQEWYDDGSKKRISVFRKGVPDSIMTFWYKNGKKGELIGYKMGKKNGREAYWNSDGQILRELNWKDGVQHGLEREWDNAGNLKLSIPWENGKKNGKELLYCQDELHEHVYHEKNWKMGLMDGKEIYWDCDHGVRKQSEVSYVDGKLEGKYIAWVTYGAKVGKIDTVVMYKDGVSLKK